MGGENRHPKLIDLGPGDHVEKYDAGFAFHKLDEENRQKLKLDRQSRNADGRNPGEEVWGRC